MPRPREAATAPATLLQLMQLASPALPVGGFSYSEGLEPAVEAGCVRSEAEAGDWLLDQLRLGLQRADIAVVARSWSAWRRHDLRRAQALNDWLRVTRESAELRRQGEQMGRSLAEWLRNSAHRDDRRVAALAALVPSPAWPVGFALAGALAGAGGRQTALAFAFGWADNMVLAATKAVPLGQAAAQRMLARLVDAIPAAVDAALRLPDAARQAFTPMLAILSAQHETQYSRLFRS
jgi:urease accessory protein